MPNKCVAANCRYAARRGLILRARTVVVDLRNPNEA